MKHQATAASGARGAADFLRLGHEALARGDRTAALAIFQEGLAACSDDRELLRAAGSVLAWEGQPAEAAKLFARLTELHRDDAEAWVSLATTLAASKDLKAIRAAVARLADCAPAKAQPWYAFGSALAERGEWHAAEKHFRAALERDGAHAEAKRALANTLMALNRSKEAVPIFQDFAVQQAANPEDWVALGHALSAAGDGLGSMRAFRVAIAIETPRVAERYGLGSLAQHMFSDIHADEVARLTNLSPTPAILVASLPKAGTEFLAGSLLSGLRKRTLGVPAGGLFPNEWFSRQAIPRLVELRPVHVCHVTASRFNLTEISERLDRMVVHVRDPRQAIISWCHFLPKVVTNLDPIQALHFDLPSDFSDWPFDRQLDWMIDNHMPHWVGWVAGWHAAASDPRFKTRILFTRHEDLVADQTAFFERLLAFYDIGPARCKE